MSLYVVLVDYLQEYIHDLFFNSWSHGHEFAINTMQNSLEVVTFTRVLTIKQLKEAVDKVWRHMLYDHIMTQVGCQNKFEKQFVDEL